VTFAARDGAPIMNGCNVESAFETPSVPSSLPTNLTSLPMRTVLSLPFAMTGADFKNRHLP